MLSVLKLGTKTMAAILPSGHRPRELDDHFVDLRRH